MKRISIHIELSLLEWLDSHSDNRSELIRRLLLAEYEKQRYLDNIKKEIKK